LLVEGAVNNAATVSYTFTVRSVADSTQALTLNSTVTGDITVTGERDSYTFTLASPARLLFDALLPSTSALANPLNWSLTGPRGVEVTNRIFSASDAANFGFSNSLLDLPAGSYTLTVDGNGDALGTYSFRLLNLTSAAAITPGTPQSGTLSSGGRGTRPYQFPTPTPDQKSYFDLRAIARGATTLH